jgi:biotin synthase-related radical SAM superfamily protein
MNNIYDTKVISTRPWAGAIEKTIQFTRKDKKPIIKISDVTDLVEGLQATARNNNDNIRILVRAMAPDGMKTLKGYNSELNAEEYEEYFMNSVKSTSKFTQFSNLQITVEKEI